MLAKKKSGSVEKPSAKINVKSKQLVMSDLVSEEPVEAKEKEKQTTKGSSAGLLPGIDVDAQVDIDDGKLVGFPVAKKLAAVTNLTELKEINFKDWTNAFSISNGRLNIKDLKINAGPTDLVVGGSQGLDGSMDYLLTVKLPGSV